MIARKVRNYQNNIVLRFINRINGLFYQFKIQNKKEVYLSECY